MALEAEAAARAENNTMVSFMAASQCLPRVWPGFSTSLPASWLLPQEVMGSCLFRAQEASAEVEPRFKALKLSWSCFPVSVHGTAHRWSGCHKDFKNVLWSRSLSKVDVQLIVRHPRGKEALIKISVLMQRKSTWSLSRW